MMRIAWVWQRCTIIARMLLYLMCPPFCTYCRQPLDVRSALCTSCYQEIQPCVALDVELTRRRSLRVYAVGKYEGPLKKLILAKGHGERVACYYMAQLMVQHLDLRQHALDYIVYIPLHWSRYAARGYNQAEEIAHALGKHIDVPVLPLLKRVKRTPFQSTLGKDDRQSNVQDAFACVPQVAAAHTIAGKRILIVDDLMTTGSTLRAAAKTVGQLKPATLIAAVLARV
jgi:ComF family protein